MRWNLFTIDSHPVYGTKVYLLYKDNDIRKAYVESQNEFINECNKLRTYDIKYWAYAEDILPDKHRCSDYDRLAELSEYLARDYPIEGCDVKNMSFIRMLTLLTQEIIKLRNKK